MESNNSGGDVDGAIRDADHVFRHRYEMPAVNHCSLETHVSIAEYDRGRQADRVDAYPGCLWPENQSAAYFELPMS